MIVENTSLSALGFLKPMFVFVIVFVTLFAVFLKQKILGEHTLINVIISFVIASVFVVSERAREVVVVSTFWFGILLVAVLFLVILVSFFGKTDDILKGFGRFFIFVVLGVFLISGFIVFFDKIIFYLPGPYYGHGGEPSLLFFFDWVYSSDVFGTFMFSLIAGVVMWVLIKYSGKKKEDKD